MKDQVIQKKNCTERKIIAAAFLCNFAVMVCAVLFLVPMAINNDDFVIHAITSGAYGEASAITVHTNVVLGWLLVVLQRIIPAINWFSTLEFLSLFMAFSLLSAMIVLQNRSYFGASLALFMTVVIAPGFYNELHNTKLSPLLAAVGLLAVYFAISTRRGLFFLFGALLALFSSFLRLHAFLTGAAFAAGVLFLLEIPAEKGLRAWFVAQKRIIVGFGVVFAVITAFAVTDILIVSADPDGSEYREYNRVRGEISDFQIPDYQLHKSEYEALGISENDYWLIDEWNFADTEKFDIETLSAIAAMNEKPDFGAVVSSLFETLSGELRSVYFLSMLILTVLGFAVSKKNRRLSFVWIIVAYCLCLFYLCYIGRTPRWVTAGISGAGIAAAAFFTALSERCRAVLARRATFVTVCVLSLSLTAVLYGSELGSYQNGFNREAGKIYGALNERGDKLYLMDQATSPANAIHRIQPTFSALPKGIFENVYVLGGWDTESAVKNAALTRQGVTGSPYRALLEQDDVFLVDTKSYLRKHIYLIENVDARVEMSLYDIIDGYYLFSFASPVDYVESESVVILETAFSADEWVGGFTYVGARLRVDVPEVTAAYIEIHDAALGTTRIFRGRIIESDETFDVVLSVQTHDLLVPKDVEIRVILATESENIASLQMPLIG